MKHFKQNQELALQERQDAKDAFALLLETGAVKRGTTESTTANLTTVLDYLLTEKAAYYKGKIDTQHDATSHKYDQLYNLIYNLTKYKAIAAVPSSKTPTRITMCGDDELNRTDTQSSALKDMQTKTCEVHLASEVLDSSLNEESESPDKMENVTIFAPQAAFQPMESQAVSQPQKLYQEESEDEEMQHVDEPDQRPEREEAEVSQIINAFNFATVFSAKAYQPKNIKVLKRAYRKHLKEAARIKKILKKLGQRVQASSDSSDSSEEQDYEHISRRALHTYSQAQKKWAK